jgi:L-aspartate oxidase
MTHVIPPETDVLVIGTGIAGLSFALRASRHARVTVITKKERPESNTNYAQGGIAAVFSPDDSPRLHAADTFVAGAGLCHRDAVEVLVREGPARVLELLELGVRFSRDGDALSLGREGGHSRRRIVRAEDLTGREVERALLAALAESGNVTLLENHLAVDLLTGRERGRGRVRCCGALVLGPDAELPEPVSARSVLLASGGCGQVYLHTTNPAIATGDGIAMAYRAGAAVANMEFIQFHPTALHPARKRSFLISEAVRGEGAVLRRIDGTALMEGDHPLGSLAPRDIVARAIDRQMKQSGDPYVLLDCSPIPPDELRARFPNILRVTAERGFDILHEPIPVVPAAHYACGGVLTDASGRSTLEGLYVVGEAACTGVHGANRLASNSLLEALVFAARAADRIGTDPAPVVEPDVPPGPYCEPAADPAEVEADREAVRSLMWELVGIVRTGERLETARGRLGEVAVRADRRWARHRPDVESVELRNLVEVARLIVECGLRRRESRGLHYNVDHPYRDNERFLRDTVLVRPVGSAA